MLFKTLDFIAKAGLLALAFCYTTLYLALWVDIFNLLTPFVLFYSFATFCIFVYFLIRRKWRYGVISVVTCTLFSFHAINWSYFTPRLSNVEPVISVTGYNQLRINKDLSEFFQDYHTKNSDLLVIQESNSETKKQAQKIRNHFPHQKHILGLRSKSLSIVSKLPFTEITRTRISEADIEQNFILEFTIPSKNNLKVFVLHTKAPIPLSRINERSKEIETLASRIKSFKDAYPDRNYIFIGDLNITPYNPHFKRLLKRSDLNIPISRPIHLYTWPSFVPEILRIQIDHILLSDNLYTDEIKIMPAYGSDHFPMFTSISLRK